MELHLVTTCLKHLESDEASASPNTLQWEKPQTRLSELTLFNNTIAKDIMWWSLWLTCFWCLLLTCGSDCTHQLHTCKVWYVFTQLCCSNIEKVWHIDMSLHIITHLQDMKTSSVFTCSLVMAFWLITSPIRNLLSTPFLVSTNSHFCY